VTTVLSKFCRQCLRNYAAYRRIEVIAGLHIVPEADVAAVLRGDSRHELDSGVGYGHN
jgi:hypothetical protein